MLTASVAWEFVQSTVAKGCLSALQCLGSQLGRLGGWV